MFPEIYLRRYQINFWW